MPPLAARQWHVLRGAPALAGNFCRPHRLWRPACAAALRSCAQLSKPDENRFPQPVPLDGAILIPASIPNAQPAEFIHAIQPVERDHISKESFCVFLVTPSFAPWLLKDDIFLEKALVRAYGDLWTKRNNKNAKPLRIHALCAVVDKLPAGRAFKSGATVEEEISRRTKEPPVAESGFEGIAYIMLPGSASVTSNAPSSPERGTIDFIVSEGVADEVKFSDILRLPLANTVFQTGTPTTMIVSSWKPRGAQRLDLMSRTNTSRHGVRIVGRNQAVDRVASTLSIPLLPLTVPRRVEGCMGNIIRRVVSSDGKSVTASSELEDVVPRFFRSRGQSAQATTAWALVIPRSLAVSTDAKTKRLLARLLAGSEKGEDKRDELWERLWRSDPPIWNTIVSAALADGARLHRVLSGGGGWGKKAGLLSLDPVPTSEPEVTDETSADGFPSMLKDPEDFASTLTPVVHDGDFIQFFITPNSKVNAEAHQAHGLEELTVLPKKNAWGLELGTIPSTVDSMPGGSWQHSKSTSNKIYMFQNSFGALAEGGLTLIRRFSANGGKPSIGNTMVDVPFSRFWAVEVADKAGPMDTVATSYIKKNKVLISKATRKLSGQHWFETQNHYVYNKKRLPSLLNLPRFGPTPMKKCHPQIHFIDVEDIGVTIDAGSILPQETPSKMEARLGATTPALLPKETMRSKADGALEDDATLRTSESQRILLEQPETPSQPRIRKYTTTGRQKNTAFMLRTANKRVLDLTVDISRLTEEYRDIMHTIRQGHMEMRRQSYLEKLYNQAREDRPIAVGIKKTYLRRRRQDAVIREGPSLPPFSSRIYRASHRDKYDGEGGHYALRKERGDELAAKVSSWLSGDLTLKDNHVLGKIKTATAPEMSQRTHLRLRYDGGTNTDVDSMGKQDSPPLPLETSTQQDRANRRRRRMQ